MTPISPVIEKDENYDGPLPEVVYAKNQPEYIPLPVVKERSGIVTSRWKLTWKERFRALIRGHIYLQIHTFNSALQPTRMSVDPPIIHWEDCIHPLDAEKMKAN